VCRNIRWATAWVTAEDTLPPMSEFFAICEYFGVTPAEFFDEKNTDPALVQKALNGLKKLGEDDLLLILELIGRMLK